MLNFLNQIKYALPFGVLLSSPVCMLSIVPTVAASATASAQIDLPMLNAAELAALLAGKRGAYMLVSNPGSPVQEYGHVQAVALNEKQRPSSRTPTPLSCIRLSLAQSALNSEDAKIFCFSIKKSSLHLEAYKHPTEFLFSSQLNLLSTFEAPKGISKPPIVNRARISPDGKYTASTVFTFGTGYTTIAGGFSTETRISKTDGSLPAENIEKWRITLNNAIITAPDLNLWGVTFDPVNTDRFLVTVATNGKPRLAQGSIARKEIHVINNTSDIECPSFSPDGKKIAFKRKKSIANQWSPAVLDLTTGVETVFEVDRSVDDQIEWLNNHTLIYEVHMTVPFGLTTISLMMLDMRSVTNKHQLFLQDARSPTFFRP
jgi:hypothetical protein